MGTTEVQSSSPSETRRNSEVQNADEYEERSCIAPEFIQLTVSPSSLFWACCLTEIKEKFNRFLYRVQVGLAKK